MSSIFIFYIGTLRTWLGKKYKKHRASNIENIYLENSIIGFLALLKKIEIAGEIFLKSITCAVRSVYCF